jgi:hypothetical protein
MPAQIVQHDLVSKLETTIWHNLDTKSKTKRNRSILSKQPHKRVFRFVCLTYQHNLRSDSSIVNFSLASNIKFASFVLLLRSV